MSVTLRQCEGKDNVWEVDIRILLPDGSKLRERRQAPVAGKAAALRWAQERERVLLREGKPKAGASVPREVPTLKEFAPRFLDGYVRANQHKPSGLASKEAIGNRAVVELIGRRRELRAELPETRRKTGGGGGSRTQEGVFR